MRYCIFDPAQHGTGFCLLFPEAKYYCMTTVSCLQRNHSEFTKIYDFDFLDDINEINADNYDILIVITSLYQGHKQNINTNNIIIFNTVKKIIQTNSFKKIYLFDNDDFDYDPSEILNITDKNIIYFKRNFNSNKNYNNNVYSFPFFIFGTPFCILWKALISHSTFDNINERKDSVFWSGTLFKHMNECGYEVNRDRFYWYSKISDLITDIGYLPNDIFLELMSMHKYGLDLYGVGDPNRRTIELLVTRTLIIQQKTNLKWPFEDGNLVNKKLQWETREEFQNILEILKDEETYNYYLKEQNRKYDTYFTKEWLRNYIEFL